MTIKKNRKEVVKAIMDLQDFITELHKAAISLSIFYRNRVSSSRYQRVITQLPDESAVEEKDIEIPVRVVSGKSPLMRQESVHHIPVLSPDAFNAARRAAYEQERIQQQMEEERGDRATEMEHALEEERVNEIRKMVASAKQRKEKELDRVLDETLDEVLNHKESASGKVESARRAEPSCEHSEPLRERRAEPSCERHAEPDRVCESKPSFTPLSESQPSYERLPEREQTHQRYPEPSYEHYPEPSYEPLPEREQTEQPRTPERIEVTYQPKYQWLKKGSEMYLILIDVDFDQDSLRCITRSDLSPPVLVIEGYRVIPMKRHPLSLSAFYHPRSICQYLPFTTVIPIPKERLNLDVPPKVIYYDEDRVLQVTYQILPPTRAFHQQPFYQNMPFFYSPHREAFSGYEPYEESRERAEDEGLFYDPRDEEEEENDDYSSSYYCNPYSFRRQQRRYPGRYSPFFGGNIWWSVCCQPLFSSARRESVVFGYERARVSRKPAYLAEQGRPRDDVH